MDESKGITRLTKIVFSRVLFTGDKLGPDYEFNFAATGQSATIKVNMTKKREAELNKDIFSISELPEVRRIPLRIEALERDKPFSDTGSLETELNIAYPEPREQSTTFDVIVYGKGREIRKQSKASITLITCLDKGLRYVAGLNPNSWLSVDLDVGFQVQLPHFLGVELVEMTSQGTHFRILEGRFKGELAQISSSAGSDYLRQEIGVRKESARLHLRKSSQRLQIAGLGEFSVVLDPRNPLPMGSYVVEIPDEPHELGRPYLDQAKYARTWFRLGETGDRYLHTGRVSAGCVTVETVDSWDSICKFLLRCRLDSKAIGILEVLP